MTILFSEWRLQAAECSILLEGKGVSYLSPSAPFRLQYVRLWSPFRVMKQDLILSDGTACQSLCPCVLLGDVLIEIGSVFLNDALKIILVLSF